MKKEPIPERNRTPTGWWITQLLMRFQPYDCKPTPRSICTVWANDIIIRAKDRNQAYTKAMRLGKQAAVPSCVRIEGKDGEWIFEGITTLLPIYDKLEDGSEVRWTAERAQLSKIKSWVRKKSELECFNDKAQ